MKRLPAVTVREFNPCGHTVLAPSNWGPSCRMVDMIPRRQNNIALLHRINFARLSSRRFPEVRTGAVVPPQTGAGRAGK